MGTSQEQFTSEPGKRLDKPSFWRFAALWAPVLLVAMGLLSHAGELVGGRPYWRDLHQIFVPGKQYLAQTLARGELPLWWPWDGTGAPLLAQPVFSTFHPTSVLYLVLPFWAAFTAQRVSATLGALLGMYVFVRSLRVSRRGSLVAAACFGLGGYVVSLSEFTFMHLATAAMPWYAWALVEAQRRGGARLVVPALVMALILLAGDPQTAILAAALGMALVVGRRRHRRRGFALALGAPVFAALLSAAQLLPSLALMPMTERRANVLEAHDWALGLRHLAGLVLPVQLDGSDWGRSVYLGGVSIGLAVVALVYGLGRRRGVVVPLAICAVVGLWLAVGSDGGLHAVVSSTVPLWAKFRYPIKSLVLAVFALSALAGIGFDLLSRRGLVVAAVVAAGVVAMGGVLSSGPTFEPMALGVAIAAVVLVGGARRQATVASLAAVALAAHLGAEAGELQKVESESFYEPSPLVEKLKGVGVGLEGAAFDRPFTTPNLTMDQLHVHARRGAGGLGTSLGAVWELPTLTPSLPGASWRMLELWNHHQEVMRARLLGVFGASFVVLREPVDEALRAQVIGRDEEAGLAVVKLRRSLPRAYAVHRGRPAMDGQHAIALVTSTSFKPGREVIVEDLDAGEAERRPDEPAQPATIVARTNDSVVVRASLPWPGFVVLNEAWFPGWTATVDGRAVPVLPANGLVRAVQASAGDHEIVFRYTAPGFSVGLAVSLASLLLLVVCAAGLAWRRGAPVPRPG